MDAQRMALVTGANKGIGLEIARQLAQAGVSVLMGARNLERGRAAAADLTRDGLVAEAIEIDLTEHTTIKAAADEISAGYGKLDILVNNAGIVDAGDGAPSTGSVDAALRIMETNFLGTLAVTQAMLPLLRQSPSGRIVNLSTTLGSLTINADPSSPYYEARLIGYNASRPRSTCSRCNWRRNWRGTPIAVNAVAPGYVKADLTGHNGPMTPE